MTRAAAGLGLVLVAGCAYLNGIYNARQAEKRGDRHARAGRAAQAVAVYETTATKAESVLASHGDSEWAREARYLAGRGWALAGHCDRATPHLEQLLGAGVVSGERRERATVALGICRVSERRFEEGRAMLTPLTRARDPSLARQAALWAGRASLALDQPDSALSYLRLAGEDARDWEFVAHHLSRGELAPAESALARRAAAADRSPRLETALLELWGRGGNAHAERVLVAADASRLSPSRLGRLHIALGDLWLEAANDSAAVAHFERAARLSRDTLVTREAAARRTAIAIRSFSSAAEVEEAIAAVRVRARGTDLLRRLEDNLLLMKLLQQRDDLSGAGVFLAAEVARDSLRAPPLARALFARLGEPGSRSPFAAKALLAAAALDPDSGEAIRAAARERHPTSPYTLFAERNDGALRDSVAALDAALGTTWSAVTKAWSDSVAQLRRDPHAPALAAPAAPAAPPLPRP